MKPHIHAEVIKLWADGAEIEYKATYENSTWNLCVVNPSWSIEFEYRAAKVPVMAWFRVCETKNGTWTANSSFDLQDIESSPNFIRWLTDRIEYEITE